MKVELKNIYNEPKDIFTLGKISSDRPVKNILEKDLVDGINLLDFLVSNNIMTSKSEARRAINNNGIKINDELEIDEKKTIKMSDFLNKNMKISFGKKKHYQFKIIQTCLKLFE